MAVVESIVESIAGFLFKRLGAAQICWLCLAATLALGWFVTANYAQAQDVSEIRSELADLKADSVAKRIFDYRVRQCDTPAEQRQEKRWLAEQLRFEVDKYEKITGKQFLLPACGDL